MLRIWLREVNDFLSKNNRQNGTIVPFFITKKQSSKRRLKNSTLKKAFFGFLQIQYYDSFKDSIKCKIYIHQYILGRFTKLIIVSI